MFKNVRAVFFDAAGTLFRPFPSVGAVYARVARKYGCHVPARWIDRRFRTEWRRGGGLARLGKSTEAEEKAWWKCLVRTVFGSRFPGKRFDGFFEELYERFARPEVWRLYPDALPALRQLRRRGFRLGIVSNWDSRLFRVCWGLGVDRKVDFIAASAAVGVAKPNPKIFRRALRLARVAAGEALHVGDGFAEDYLGARRAGLKALFLRRSGERPRGVDAVLSLREVPRRLERPPVAAGKGKIAPKKSQRGAG